MEFTYKMWKEKGTWVAPSIKRLTLDLIVGKGTCSMV